MCNIGSIIRLVEHEDNIKRKENLSLSLYYTRTIIIRKNEMYTQIVLVIYVRRETESYILYFVKRAL